MSTFTAKNSAFLQRLINQLNTNLYETNSTPPAQLSSWLLALLCGLFCLTPSNLLADSTLKVYELPECSPHFGAPIPGKSKQITHHAKDFIGKVVAQVILADAQTGRFVEYQSATHFEQGNSTDQIILKNFAGKYDLPFRIVKNQYLELDTRFAQLPIKAANPIDPALVSNDPKQSQKACWLTSKDKCLIVSRAHTYTTDPELKTFNKFINVGEINGERFGYTHQYNGDIKQLISYAPASTNYIGSINYENPGDPTELTVRFENQPLYLVECDIDNPSKNAHVYGGIILKIFTPNSTHQYYDTQKRIQNSRTLLNYTAATRPNNISATYKVKNFANEGVCVASPYADVDPSREDVTGNYVYQSFNSVFFNQINTRIISARANNNLDDYIGYDYFRVIEGDNYSAFIGPEFIFTTDLYCSTGNGNGGGIGYTAWENTMLRNHNDFPATIIADDYGVYATDFNFITDPGHGGKYFQSSLCFGDPKDPAKYTAGIKVRIVEKQLSQDTNNPIDISPWTCVPRHECNMLYGVNAPYGTAALTLAPEYFWDRKDGGKLNYYASNKSRLNWKIEEIRTRSTSDTFYTKIPRREHEVAPDISVTTSMNCSKYIIDAVIHLNGTVEATNNKMTRDMLDPHVHVYVVPGLVTDIRNHCSMISNRKPLMPLTLDPNTGFAEAIELTNYYLFTPVKWNIPAVATNPMFGIMEMCLDNIDLKREVFSKWQFLLSQIAKDPHFITSCGCTIYYGLEYNPSVSPRHITFHGLTYLDGTYRPNYAPSSSDSIEVEGATEVARYDTMGREVGDDYRGMVVIRYSDGSVKKQLNK